MDILFTTISIGSARLISDLSGVAVPIKAWDGGTKRIGFREHRHDSTDIRDGVHAVSKYRRDRNVLGGGTGDSNGVAARDATPKPASVGQEICACRAHDCIGRSDWGNQVRGVQVEISRPGSRHCDAASITGDQTSDGLLGL